MAAGAVSIRKSAEDTVALSGGPGAPGGTTGSGRGGERGKRSSASVEGRRGVAGWLGSGSNGGQERPAFQGLAQAGRTGRPCFPCGRTPATHARCGARRRSAPPRRNRGTRQRTLVRMHPWHIRTNGDTTGTGPRAGWSADHPPEACDVAATAVTCPWASRVSCSGVPAARVLGATGWPLAVKVAPGARV